MAQKHGQQKLDEINQKIIEDGLKPTSTMFLTLKNTLLASKQELKEMQTQFAQHRSNLRTLNDQSRYTGQYYATKEVYSQFSNAKYKGKYRKEHTKEIQKYEEARDWLLYQSHQCREA